MSDNILVQNTKQIYNRRVRCEYTTEEKHLIELSKAILYAQIEYKKATGDLDIYENQEAIAYKILAEFSNSKILNVMVVSRTQSGKTGSMCATIYFYLRGNLIPPENIYIITGHSSCEWKKQTKERLPDILQERIFHRSDLPTTFVDEIKNKKNVLIIMDEIQVAAKKDQTIYKAFKAAGLLDKQKLYENDVKILEYTATPDGTIYDLMKWDNASAKILADAGQGYIGSNDLLQQGRLKQYQDLCGYDKKTKTVDINVYANIRELKADVDSFTTPRYHIIRTKNGTYQDITRNNFFEVFGTTDYIFKTYDAQSEVDNINKTLVIRPSKHTIIFIKEMLRCSKTLVKRFLGVVYERYAIHPDDGSIIQGLIGRITGYDDNGDCICYTNLETIVNYEMLWNSKFEDTSIPWRSKTTKFKNGVLQGVKTFNDPKEYDGFSEYSDDTEEEEPVPEPHIREFATQDELKQYFKDVLKPIIMGGNGPKKTKPNENTGYYESTIRGKKRVYSYQEIYTERKQGLSLTENNYRHYACYRDINDKSTLVFCMIHYDILPALPA